MDDAPEVQAGVTSFAEREVRVRIPSPPGDRRGSSTVERYVTSADSLSGAIILK
jgi:hypothetical protein